MGPNDYDIAPGYWWTIVQDAMKAHGDSERAVRDANSALHAYRIQFARPVPPVTE